MDGEDGSSDSFHDFEIDMEVLSKASKTSSRSKPHLTRNLGGSRHRYKSEEDNLSIFSLNSDFGGGNDEDDSDSAVETVLRSDRSLGSFSSLSSLIPNRTLIISILVGMIGTMASTMFMGYGIGAAVQEQEQRFQQRAHETIADFENAWAEYETAALWLHQACGIHPITRLDFFHIYEYLNSTVTVHVSSLTLPG